MKWHLSCCMKTNWITGDLLRTLYSRSISRPSLFLCMWVSATVCMCVFVRFLLYYHPSLLLSHFHSFSGLAPPPTLVGVCVCTTIVRAEIQREGEREARDMSENMFTNILQQYVSLLIAASALKPVRKDWNESKWNIYSNIIKQEDTALKMLNINQWED